MFDADLKNILEQEARIKEEISIKIIKHIITGFL
jgi:hypothetical protein